MAPPSASPDPAGDPVRLMTSGYLDSVTGVADSVTGVADSVTGAADPGERNHTRVGSGAGITRSKTFGGASAGELLKPMVPKVNRLYSDSDSS